MRAPPKNLTGATAFGKWKGYWKGSRKVSSNRERIRKGVFLREESPESPKCL